MHVGAAVELGRRLQKDDPKRARELLERAARMAPESPAGLAGLADLDLAAGDAAGAEARLGEVVARGEATADVYLIRARLRAAQGRLPEAAADAEAAFERAPERHAMADFLVRVRSTQGSADQAIEKLERAEAQGRLSAPSRLMLARLENERGNTGRSLEILEAVYEEQPDLPFLRNDLAFLLAAERGDLSRARKLAEQQFQGTPGNPQVLHTLGYIYLRAGLWELAELRLQEGARLAEEQGVPSGEAYYHLGLAHRMRRHNESAANAFERALELDPELPEAEHARSERKAALLGAPPPENPF
jgi:tetratricopeptide (TPR) repeat protein